MITRPRPADKLGARVERVDLGGEDEVALAQALDGVRVDFDLGVAPAEREVGMMPLSFGQRADAIDERERGVEVGKLISAPQVVLEATHVSALEWVSLEELQAHAVPK